MYQKFKRKDKNSLKQKFKNKKFNKNEDKKILSKTFDIF